MKFLYQRSLYTIYSNKDLHPSPCHRHRNTPHVAFRLCKDRSCHPRTACHRILQLSGSCIIEIVVSPSCTFGAEENLFTIIKKLHTPHLVVKIRLVVFMYHHPYISSFYINLANISLVPRTVIALYIKTLAIFAAYSTSIYWSGQR